MKIFIYLFKLKDWVEVIKQIDFNTTYWSSDNRTCSIPNSINMDILYNKAGFLYDKQYSVITAKLYSNYKYDRIFYNEIEKKNIL